MFAIIADYDPTRRMIRRGLSLLGHPMRTLRQIQCQIRGRIQAASLGNAPATMISVIFGAYLSLQIVAQGSMIG